ncbi:MAG: PqqD family protein [Clostridia bacterium]|nr:PqqD family protein [Clostridia bacterium]
MKIKDGFILREIAGSFVVVPVGQNLVDFSTMITLNETAAFLWNCLSEGASEEELCEKLLSEYEGVTKEDALADIKEIVKILEEKNILE